jgi:hypothetical protein
MFNGLIFKCMPSHWFPLFHKQINKEIAPSYVGFTLKVAKELSQKKPIHTKGGKN